MSGAIVLRSTVSEIVAHRDNALKLYGAAHSALVEAERSLQAAGKANDAASPGINSYNQHLEEDAAKSHLKGFKVPDRDFFMTTARRFVDTDVWAYVMRLTNLETLMDKKAKDQLRQQLMKDPPEATEENIFATVEQFTIDADTIFKRGIAECFSNLDRRFRSHDGWKIGSRVILSYTFDEYGSWNYHRNHRDTLVDIERTFLVLDGRKHVPEYGGVVDAGRAQAREGGWGKRQTEIETEFFLIRCYKNGNCHLWFRRDDVLEKVNKLLGEYYGAVIPEDRDPDPDTGLHAPKTTLAKNYGFFPTPDAAVSELLGRADLYRRDEEDPRLTVLEPSAGTGNLARPMVKGGAIVDCVEIHPERTIELAAEGIYRRVMRGDFLHLRPDPENLYDRVVMNPPFDRERDIDHVMHALKFLKPDGLLVAIMSAGTEFRETRKSTAFREHIAKLNGDFRDLPAGSFSSVGTHCNTVILKVCKDGRNARW